MEHIEVLRSTDRDMDTYEIIFHHNTYQLTKVTVCRDELRVLVSAMMQQFSDDIPFGGSAAAYDD